MVRRRTRRPDLRRALIALLLFCLLAGCARYEKRGMEATAYCGCGHCCSWERGSWKYLKIDFWNRYVSAGARKGKTYTGHTARGTRPRQYYPGLFSMETLKNPLTLPFKIVLLPWFLFPEDGTIAADTRYHAFGTRMYVPGYGWGVVEDRGGAIKGPTRIDLYYRDHDDALAWGRQFVQVTIEE